MNEVICKICNNKATTRNYDSKKDKETIDCDYCGKYYLMNLFESDIYDNKKSDFYKISSWIREQNDEFNIYPEIDDKKFIEILNSQDKRIQEKFELFMKYLSKNQIKTNIYCICWIKDDNEFESIYNKAKKLDYVKGNIEVSTSGGIFNSFNGLTFEGLEYIESLNNINKSSKNIFVAFNFEDELNEVFNTHLNQAITENGFNYVVVNQNNVEHNKSINDEIIVKLKSSRIVIADFTNHRNSVYFEAGFAMGMNIPIIWTCQEGHDKEMSFDTRQFPHIIWKDKDDLVKQVIDRIKVIL